MLSALFRKVKMITVSKFKKCAHMSKNVFGSLTQNRYFKKLLNCLLRYIRYSITVEKVQSKTFSSEKV